MLARFGPGQGCSTRHPIGRPCSAAFRDSSSPIRSLYSGAHYPLGRDKAGYYSTAPLEKTLTELVDFALVKRCMPRLTVGAAHVRTSQMRYFDSREMAITARHIMASGALPPAFPAIRIDGELYWDGGFSPIRQPRQFLRTIRVATL